MYIPYYLVFNGKTFCLQTRKFRFSGHIVPCIFCSGLAVPLYAFKKVVLISKIYGVINKICGLKRKKKF